MKKLFVYLLLIPTIQLLVKDVWFALQVNISSFEIYSLSVIHFIVDLIIFSLLSCIIHELILALLDCISWANPVVHLGLCLSFTICKMRFLINREANYCKILWKSTCSYPSYLQANFPFPKFWIFGLLTIFSRFCWHGTPWEWKFENATPPTVKILFQATFFWIFPMTIITRVTSWHFEVWNFFSKRLKFLLTWDPTCMGVKISKCYSSYSYESFSTSLFLNVPCDSLKVAYRNFEN